MAEYQLMEFDEELFLHDLLDGLDHAMINAIQVVFGSHPYFDGNSEKTQTMSGIEYDIHSTDFKAWILEYGKGKYLDESNPYLDEYKNSLYWNSKRESHGNAILYRGNGVNYSQLDYQSGSGTYEATGVGNPDLEVPDWAQGVRPSPFIDKLLKQVWALFKTDSIEIIRKMEDAADNYFRPSSSNTLR